MIAIYARANHPPGYGYPAREDENGCRAHGYSVIYVKYHGKLVLRELDKRLSWGEGLPEPFSHHDQWYGGNSFERIGVIPGYDIDIGPSAPQLQSRGDNKFVGIYDAEDLLKEPPANTK